MILVKKHKQQGFSLLELAIVVTIIGITVGAGLTVMNEYSRISKISQTKLIIEEVMTVINLSLIHISEPTRPY